MWEDHVKFSVTEAEYQEAVYQVERLWQSSFAFCCCGWMSYPAKMSTRRCRVKERILQLQEFLFGCNDGDH